MTLQPFAVAPVMGLLAATPVAGFALQNATPSIISWTAPNDGQLHRVMGIVQSFVTALETGGAVAYSGTDPAGNLFALTALAAGLGAGAHTTGFPVMTVKAGSTFTIVQQSALSAGGPTTVWAEIWGS